MKSVKWILALILSTSLAQAANTVVIDGVSKDGVTVTITSGATPIPPTPPPIPPPPIPPPTPIPSWGCNTNYLSGTPRAGVMVADMSMCWVFDIPAEKKGVLVQIIGRNDYSDSHMVWTFPDGRTFPAKEDEGWILGPGTRSVNMQLRSKSTFSPNIPDTYIPQGRHMMTITGRLDGFMTVGF